MKDYEALQKIKRGNLYYVSGVGYSERIDKDSLPVKKIQCKRSLCMAEQMTPVMKITMGNGQKGVIARCHKCGQFYALHISNFEEQKIVRVRFDDSTARLEAIRMRFNGCSEEKIEEKLEFFKEEFEKEDRKKKIQNDNFLAEIRARAVDAQLKSEQTQFKANLDSGLYVFDAKARAFYNTETGVVVRKL